MYIRFLLPPVGDTKRPKAGFGVALFRGGIGIRFKWFPFLGYELAVTRGDALICFLLGGSGGGGGGTNTSSLLT